MHRPKADLKMGNVRIQRKSYYQNTIKLFYIAFAHVIFR